MSLFKPYWMSVNENRLSSIARKIKREKYEKRMNIALNAPSFAVKAIALDNLTCDDVSAVLKELDKEELKHIIPKMEDQWLAVDDLRVYSDEMLCLIASNLTEEYAITEFAGHCFNKSAAEILVEKNITNKNLLKELMDWHSSNVIIEGMSEKIDNPLIFAEALTERRCMYNTYDCFVNVGGTTEMLMHSLPEDGKEFYFPEEAIKDIEDKEFLVRIILYCQNREAKEAAVDKLQEDWKLCLDLYNDKRVSGDDKYRLLDAVFKNSDDQSLIVRFAISSPYWDVRELALTYVKSRKTLLKIASSDSDQNIRDKAKDMLDDPDLDEYIKENCNHSGSEHVLYDFDEFGRQKVLAIFSTCKFCGQISLLSTNVPDITDKCPIAYDEKHVFVRRHISQERFGERVSYQCSECRQSIYGYEQGRNI